MHHPLSDRRKFILNLVKSAGGLALLSLQPLHLAAAGKPLTVQDVINIIMREGKLSPRADTVDTLKSGQAGQTVTGIVTTMFPTIEVIKETARRGANFIIAHEPSFYNHLDDTGWVKNNSVLQQKLQLLEQHNIAVWRFHDYCHALRPDAISYGVAKKAGWLSYFKTGESVLTVPAQPLQQLVQHLKSSLGIKRVRVIGDAGQPCTKVALLPGAWGGQAQVGLAESEKPDVLVVGEVHEWETAEYIRDARMLGRKISLVILGHSVSEEPGMEWLVDWLRPKVQGITVTHIPSEDPFTWM